MCTEPKQRGVLPHLRGSIPTYPRHQHVGGWYTMQVHTMPCSRSSNVSFRRHMPPPAITPSRLTPYTYNTRQKYILQMAVLGDTSPTNASSRSSASLPSSDPPFRSSQSLRYPMREKFAGASSTCNLLSISIIATKHGNPDHSPFNQEVSKSSKFVAEKNWHENHDDKRRQRPTAAAGVT